MADYQVLARKYRPQSFSEVLGQDPIVTTLKNAIKNKRLAHAYLFCGSRGTGKTTLARVFAKALNCLNPSPEGEPCNHCASCKEITSGNSLDVLEIDGASHRGIDDVRQINETVGYATASGGYKIYIIDEVHMLTKEAFNALLKTLEEPPAKVIFFFATTEPHKVIPTILSRCQRFNLSRIPTDLIMKKLMEICKDQRITIEEEALRLIAMRAEGGLRDAESLLDQIISFHEGSIKTETVNSILGILSRDSLFALDRAGKEGNLAIAFELAHQVFSQGKDLVHFVETLTEHFRNLLLVKISGKDAPFLELSENEKNLYESSSKLYSQEQCLNLLEYLAEAQQQIRFMSSGRIGLENILLHILRSHQRLPVEYLVKRLTEIEKNLNTQPPSSPPMKKSSTSSEESMSVDPTQKNLNIQTPPSPPVKKSTPPTTERSMSVDPTPSPADLGVKSKSPPNPQNQNKYDTLLQFAAVELEGTIQKKKA